MSPCSELVPVAHINEEIKQVVIHTRSVYLAALNAMFVARKIKGNGSGFASVTKELQLFSHKLNELTNVVETEIAQLISSSAQAIKTRRMHRLYEEALKSSGDKLGELSRRQAFNQIKSNSDIIDLLKSTDRQRILLTLEKLDKHCSIGSSLSVLAKIESSTTGQFTKELSNISLEIEKVIDDIQANINAAILQHTKAA